MAKLNKSGLGRGLSTLMGGSFEESSSKSSKPERTRVTVDPGEIPEYDPILEPSTMRAMPRPTKKAPAPTSPQKPAPTSTKDSEKTSEASNQNAEDQSKKTSAESTSSPDKTAKEKPATESSKNQPPAESSASESKSENEPTLTKDDVDKVVTIPLAMIEPNPNQPRTNFNKDELEELAASISREGLLQPIIVRRVDKDKYQIVAGERRWQACKMAGLETVPIIFKDVNEDKAIELALIENLQRSDLNPIEEAYGYRRLMDRKRWTQAQLALAMSKGRSTIANALRLLDLPEDAQQLLFEDKIKAGHARAILSVPTAEGREKLTEKLKNEKLSVRETENIARLMSYHEKPSKPSNRPTIPDSYKRVAKALRDVLNTTVRVRSSKGKNRIEIDFTDQDELDRIFEDLIATKEESQ